jgi:hypothetical protein
VLLELLGVKGAQKIILDPVIAMIGGEEKLIEELQKGIAEFLDSPINEATKKANNILPKLLPNFNIDIDINELFEERELCIVITKKEGQTQCNKQQ